MVGIAQIDFVPGHPVSNAELPSQRTHHWYDRGELDDALEKRANADVKLDHDPVAPELLNHQFFDSTDFPSIHIEQGTPDERLDVDFERRRIPSVHDHGICLTILSRSHFSNAIIGVLLTSRSTRSDGPSKPMRE